MTVHVQLIVHHVCSQMNGAARSATSDAQWSYRLKSVAVCSADPDAVSVDALVVIRDLQSWLLSIVAKRPEYAPAVW